MDLNIAKFVLSHKLIEKHNLPLQPIIDKISASERDVFNAVTHILGYMLGDELYAAMVADSPKVSKEMVRDLYCNPFASEGDPRRVYFDLVNLLH